jgi:hypothetical protein
MKFALIFSFVTVIEPGKAGKGAAALIVRVASSLKIL